MFRIILLLGVLLPLPHIQADVCGSGAVVCYLLSWSVWWPGRGQFHAGMLDPNLCTHVIYSYIGLNSTTFTVRSRDPKSDYFDADDKTFKGFDNIEKLMSRKARNPNLKLLVSIGGWGEGSESYSAMAANATYRKTFIDSVLEYLKKHKFDGLDIDWEFPADRGGLAHDKYHFTTLLRELRARMGEDMLLSVHLSGKRYALETGYELSQVGQLADLVIVKGYDYVTPQGRVIGPAAPLYFPHHQLTLASTIDFLVAVGVPPSKLIAGLGLFGRAYIADQDFVQEKYMGVPSTQTFSGQLTNEDGLLSFNEICSEIKRDSSWMEMWDDNSSTPFAVNGRKLISYDNRESIRTKMEVVKSRKLCGAAVYSVDMDDFRGICYGKRYPLTSLVKELLQVTPTEELESEIPVQPMLIPPIGDDEKVVMCYLSSWSVWRREEGQFHAGHVHPHLCSHIVYSYVGLNGTTNQLRLRDPRADFILPGKKSFGNLAHLVSLKNENPKLKILVSIGGYADGSENYSRMAKSESKRKIFIDSVLDFVRRNKLDGFDIDWQFPTDRGGEYEDRENFVTLLKELRQRLRGLLLTVKLGGRRYIMESSYNIKEISEQVDYMSIEAYLYRTPWEKRTGTNAPLSGDSLLNVVDTVNYILKEGAEPKKVLLGLPAFGHSYLLDSDPGSVPFLNLPSSETFQGPFSYESGMMGFNEICWEQTRNPGWKTYWNEETTTPYTVFEKKYISYDNEKSIREKVKLVDSRGLGGVMIYSLDTDDFRGLCYGRRYPLVCAARAALHSDQPVDLLHLINHTEVISHVVHD